MKKHDPVPSSSETKILFAAEKVFAERGLNGARVKDIAELSRTVRGAVQAAGDLDKRLDQIRQALHQTTGASQDMMDRAKAMKDQLREIRRKLNGDRTISSRNENQPPSISGRVRMLTYSQWRSTSAPTQTMRDQYRIAGEEFKPLLAELKQLAEVDLKNLENEMEAAGAPWTPGRIPEWNK